jgi:outer membrane immunogenic protein
MKKQLLAAAAILAAIPGSAMAADLSRPAPAPAPVYKAPPPVYFSWTGCYFGGNGGGVWVRKTLTAAAGSGFPVGTAEGSLDVNGGIFGGQVGCNYQVSAWVFGIQGDWDWSGASASVADPLFLGFSDSAKTKSLASVTGRLGYGWDRFLLYAKGGGAWERDDYSATFGVLTSTVSDTRSGWTVGGGGEYAFTDWLTGFAEFDYYDFGTRTENFVGTAGAFGISVKETKSVAKAGLNIKFGGWGLMSRY